MRSRANTAGERAKGEWFEGELEPAFERDGKVTTSTTACGRTARSRARRTQAGVRAAVGQGDGRQQLADHRRRILGDPRLRRRGEAAWPDAAREDCRQRMGRARSVGHGLGPVLCSTSILRRNGLGLADIGLWEINEAFAAQVLACLAAWQDDNFCREILHLDRRGGPHPARQAQRRRRRHRARPSGRRERQPIVLHLVNAMRRLGIKQGIATECIGGGQGGAMLIEAV